MSFSVQSISAVSIIKRRLKQCAVGISGHSYHIRSIVDTGRHRQVPCQTEVQVLCCPVGERNVTFRGGKVGFEI